MKNRFTAIEDRLRAIVAKLTADGRLTEQEASEILAPLDAEPRDPLMANRARSGMKL